MATRRSRLFDLRRTSSARPHTPKVHRDASHAARAAPRHWIGVDSQTFRSRQIRKPPLAVWARARDSQFGPVLFNEYVGRRSTLAPGESPTASVGGDFDFLPPTRSRQRSRGSSAHALGRASRAMSVRPLLWGPFPAFADFRPDHLQPQTSDLDAAPGLPLDFMATPEFLRVQVRRYSASHCIVPAPTLSHASCLPAPIPLAGQSRSR